MRDDDEAGGTLAHLGETDVDLEPAPREHAGCDDPMGDYMKEVLPGSTSVARQVNFRAARLMAIAWRAGLRAGTTRARWSTWCRAWLAEYVPAPRGRTQGKAAKQPWMGWGLGRGRGRAHRRAARPSRAAAPV